MATAVWHLLAPTKHSDESLSLSGDYNLIKKTRHTWRKDRFSHSYSRIPSIRILCNSGIVELYAFCLSLSRMISHPWLGVTRHNHHHLPFFLNLSSFLFYCWRPFSLWWESIKKNSSYMGHRERWQMAITPSCTTRTNHNTVPHYFRSVGLFRTSDKLVGIDHFPPPSQTTKSHRYFLLQSVSPSRLLEDWHWLIAHSGLKIGKTRQDKLSTKYIPFPGAQESSGCFTSEKCDFYIFRTIFWCNLKRNTYIAAVSVRRKWLRRR